MTSDSGKPPQKAAAGTPKPPSRITAKWVGGQRFDTSRPGGAVARFDGNAETGQSPPEALLSALASCAAIDVVEILAKRRTPAESLEVDVVGDRFDGTPRRFTHITLIFRLSGAGIEKEQAERAIELSVNKYCTVRDSLRQDIGIEWKLELAEEASGVAAATK